ncbi:MAG: peptide chain release factor N(5)-glutamine methyltransferase [Desulfamplus sp.]|nr:peptide chain release factor N(5)-glutamine methyltransferase [Desulfamplus sp.]
MLSNYTAQDKNVPDRWTILKLLAWTEGYFKSYNIDSPRLTAEILLCHSLNIRRLDLYLQFDRPLNKDELATYKSLIKRRVKKEPVAYITGNKGFWDSQFAVTTDVLIPRPDTETLVEAALGEIEQKRKGQREVDIVAQNNFSKNNEPEVKESKHIDSKTNIKVLELGTGSGAIAVSLAKTNPDVIFFATDISPKAAIVAKRNSLNAAISLDSVPPASSLHVSTVSSYSVPVRNERYKESLYLPNLSFLVGSWFSPIKHGTRFDIIISNPPYIPTDGISTLQQEVRDYEPRLALDGGPDGISCLREIMLSAPYYLAPDGVLLMEMGFDQKYKVEYEALKISQYEAPVFIKDYAGHNRVVCLKKIRALRGIEAEK